MQILQIQFAQMLFNNTSWLSDPANPIPMSKPVPA